jgi:hypothetical protein
MDPMASLRELDICSDGFSNFGHGGCRFLTGTIEVKRHANLDHVTGSQGCWLYAKSRWPTTS